MLRLLMSLMLLLVGAGTSDVVRSGTIELIGGWDDDRNFSGAVFFGDLLVIAADELGYLQVGRRDARVRDRFARVGEVRLVPRASGGEVEVDVEALASDGDVVYALGSHSASRRRGDRANETHARNLEQIRRGPRRHPERHAVFRFRLDPATGEPTRLERASLDGAIVKHAVLAPFVGLPGKENGVDLEGLAVADGTLFAGFRGPVLRHGLVPVLRFTFAAPDEASLLFVALDGLGVRDLARVTDGFLLLAGPVGDGDVPHRIYWWNGRDCVPGQDGAGGRVRLLGTVPAPPGGKAEALVLTGEHADVYDAVVFYDAINHGGPVRVQIPRSSDTTTPAMALCGGAA
jgi:hypothetical protein